MSVLPSPPTDHNPRCLGCGAENPRSTGFVVTEHESGRLGGRVAFDGLHEGAPGRVHGGAVATALDEALGQLGTVECGGDCATAEMTVRYLRPTPTGSSYDVEAWLASRDGRKMRMRAELRRGGEVLATAEALMIALARDAGTG